MQDPRPVAEGITGTALEKDEKALIIDYDPRLISEESVRHAREKSYQFILYKESSQQGKTAPGLSRATPQQGQIDQTSLLGGTSKPNWGPLPLAIRW